MASFFPGGQDTWVAKVDLVDTILATHVNDLQNAVASLETGGVSTQNIAYAASITPNVPAGQYVIVGTLTGNITVNAPTNALTGRRLTFRFTQDGTGNRTVTWNAVFSVTNWTVNTAANAKTEATFTYDGSSWVLASNPLTGVVTDKGGMVYHVEAYAGATGDVKFQAANDAAFAAGGGTVYGPPKPYTFAVKLQLDTGVTLWMDPKCVITRGFAGGGTQNATVRNRNQTTSDTDITVIGGTFQTTSGANTGRHLGFVNVTRLGVYNTRILTNYVDWNTGFENITYGVISGLFITNTGAGLGQDGIHVRSGQYIAISDCTVFSGDDCIALEQGSNTGDAGQTLGNLSDIAVSNCTVKSAAGRAFLAAITGTSTGTLRRVAFSNIAGSVPTSAAYAYMIADLTAGTFSVQDVTADNIELDASGQSGTSAGGIVQNASHVWLERANVNSPQGHTLSIASASDVWADKVRGTPRGASQNYVNLSGTNTNINILNPDSSASPNHGINFQSCTGGSVIGGKITGAASGTGINVVNSTGLRILGVQVTLCNVGIWESGTSDHNRVAYNDLRGNTGAIAFPGGASSFWWANDGLNPQGVAAITVTASPFTYTNADSVAEMVHIDGGTVTTVAKNAITLHSFGGTAARCAVFLHPNEAVVTTYTVAPTMNKDRK